MNCPVKRSRGPLALDWAIGVSLDGRLGARPQTFGGLSGTERTAKLDKQSTLSLAVAPRLRPVSQATALHSWCHKVGSFAQVSVAFSPPECIVPLQHLMTR
jgi:hypothetical protein